MSKVGIYTVGGTVPIGKCYIQRRVDHELLAICRTGTFAYVLSSRQVGKSSLMIRTAQWLDKEAIRSVIIDLTVLGSDGSIEVEQWYFGLLLTIHEQLRLNSNLEQWWQLNKQQGVIQRMIKFFEELVLQEVRQKIVIFIDEIDTTLNLPFADDFYAAIRFLYNIRSTIPIFRRISFVLIGVATPSELIRDQKRTPFNIGQRVDLTDWTLEEALPLAQGLGVSPSDERRVMQWILNWTGGHPYLTQHLCQTIASQRVSSKKSREAKQTDDQFLQYLLVTPITSRWTENDIRRLVRRTFFEDNSEKISNILFIRDMLTRMAPNVEEVLETYRAIYNQRRPIPDEAQSLVKSHLKLSGVVRTNKGNLLVRNKIYATIFDRRWIDAHLPPNSLRRIQARRLRQAALIFATTIVMSLFVVGGSGILAQQSIKQRDTAIMELNAANTKNATLVANEEDLRMQVSRAVEDRINAEEEMELAETKKESAIATRESAEMTATAVRASADQTEIELEQMQEGLRQAQEEANIAQSSKNEASTAVALARIGEQQSKNALAQAQAEQQSLKDQIQYSRTEALFAAIDAELPQNPSVALSLSIEAESLWQKGALSGDNIDQMVIDRLRKSVIASHEQTRIFLSQDSPITSAAFAPGGQQVLILSDGVALIWNLKETSRSHILPAHQVSLTNWSPDGAHVLTASSDGSVHIWNTTTYTLEQTLGANDQSSSAVLAAKWSNNGQYVLTTGVNGSVRLWDLSTQGAYTSVPLPQAPATTQTTLVQPTVAFQIKGMRIAIASGMNLYTWNPSDATVKTVGTHSRTIRSVAWSPNDRYLLSADDRMMRIWDVGGSQGVRPLDISFPDNVRDAIWSPDGLSILTTSEEGDVRIWRIDRSPPQATRLRGHSGSILNAVWNTDGSRILTAGSDGTARIWTLKDVDVTLIGHNSVVREAIWSNDKQSVLTLSDDGTVRVWIASSDSTLANADIKQLLAEAKKRQIAQLTVTQQCAYLRGFRSDLVCDSPPTTTPTLTP